VIARVAGQTWFRYAPSGLLNRRLAYPLNAYWWSTS